MAKSNEDIELLLKRAENAEGSDFKEIMDLNPPFDVQKILLDRATNSQLLILSLSTKMYISMFCNKRIKP